MMIADATPHVLAPGEADSLTLLLEPRRETDISGYVLISSDDAIVPVDSIRIETDIRALETTTTLLNPGATVPLGDAVTVVVTPAPQVNIERGHLYYRPIGETVFLNSVPLSRLMSQFIAVIPGEAVAEGGFEYFVRVENSGVFGTDPRGAPAVFYTQAVESPALITTEPIPTSGQDYLANREIRVQVILPTGSSFVDGAVHYRKGGTANFNIDSLTVGEVFPNATIPDSVVSAWGVEYWVEVNTLTAHLCDPPVGPSLNPRTLSVTVQNLTEPHVHKGGETADAYRIMSIPLEFKGDFAGTIEALLSDRRCSGPMIR
jgi:hypothetical protein